MRATRQCCMLVQWPEIASGFTLEPQPEHRAVQAVAQTLVSAIEGTASAHKSISAIDL